MPQKTIAELEADLHPDRGIMSRVRAVQGLRRYQHSPRAMALLERALLDPTVMIKRRALEQLGVIGTPEALRLLRKALRHSSLGVHEEAKFILSSVKRRTAAKMKQAMEKLRPRLKRLRDSVLPPRSPDCLFTYRSHRRVFFINGQKYYWSCPACDASPRQLAKAMRRPAGRA